VLDQQESDRVLFIENDSVVSQNELGGMTVNAGAVDFVNGSAAGGWMARTIERLWRLVFDLSH
jgi:hypothetical protein